MASDQRVVLLFGAPGSGKGTVGRLMERSMGIPHISTGDILRSHVEAADDLGGRVKDDMGVGKLVPDELINRMVADLVQNPDCARGFILDGYPRTLDQAAFLNRLLEAKGFQAVAVHLRVDYNKIVTRLTARRSCPVCGTVYNMESRPPKREGVCDQDGAALAIRDDDREEVIRGRLEAYERLTRPMEQFYAHQAARFLELDGADGTAEQIAAKVSRMIENP